MDPKITALFNTDILTAARQRYAIPAEKVQLLDGFESFIYEFERPDGRFILRIGHSHRQGQHSIRINQRWRICFQWKNGDCYDVEIVDYH